MNEEEVFQIEIKKVKISALVPHEGTIEKHIRKIKSWMQRDGFQLRPIAISRLDGLGPEWRTRFLIHDGHHRAAALKRLGCSRVLGSVFDFADARIKVFRYYRTSVPVPKEVVIERATSAKKVTPRYDKHFVVGKNGDLFAFHDNPMLEPENRTPLSELK